MTGPPNGGTFGGDDTSVTIDVDALRRFAGAGMAGAPGVVDEEESRRMLAARELVLLRQTLEYVGSFVPYYRQLFHEKGFELASLQRLSDFRAIPPLAKSTVVSRLDEFLSRMPGLSINSMVSTSGTTSNIRLPRFISDEELEACALLARLAANRREANPGGDILLRVFPAMRRYMGQPRHADFPQIVVTLSLHYPKYTLRSSFDDFVLKQLFDRFPIPGTVGYVTVVHTTPPFLLRMISDEMKARSLSPSETHVRCIACTGGPITNRIRSLVSDFWQTPLLTSYSMTELNGYAAGCELYPNRYHFDASLYAEVVDPVSHQPVGEGHEGVLLVTSLYPFQQAQPFVRYDTGDLVTYMGRECQCGAVGTTIEYRGRVDHCLDLSDVVPNGSGRRFLASSDLHDLFEDMPEVPSLLYPRFEVKRHDRDGVVGIEITAELYQVTGPEMTARVEDRLLAGIFDRYPELKRLSELGRVSWDIHFRNRGEMLTYVRLYPDA